ncbi:hypothetical protein AR158_C372L [Paramecium bursaria Chlorella virus AR158]|uniref:HNH endonuclease n=1 Tax=Paramecium bursaria Chlorella virus AR158 TaxID=380598 RepID=UPI00015AA6A1|nr:HNH endonuclease [Paramecium bursaria Chlorella virus AR158]ABU43917.1 hypothetical protein AR158_C372L [Paramecium bursaria Chlorella virus AR158]
MHKTVEYYYKDGRHDIFDKYFADKSGRIINKKTSVEMPQRKTKEGYKFVDLTNNDGKRKTLFVHRIIASTFIGRPPTLLHSPDHKHRDRTNNSLDNLTWKDPKEQRANQERPDTYNSAFVVVRDGVEKTINEWLEYLKDEKTLRGNAYTYSVIQHYAQRKTNGFSYKVFDDLPGEIWKEVPESKNRIGHWEISNMKRVKYVTKYAANVFDISKLSTISGYPLIFINGRQWLVHIVCFQTFYPKEYAAMKPDDMILHEDDDPMDFRPEKLRIGTRSQNMKDSYDNGKRNDTKSARKPCISYVAGVREKEHISISEAVQYLKEHDWPKATSSGIRAGIENNRKAYDRMWYKIA